MTESANEKLGLPRDTMKKVVIAFDVDGTLRDNENTSEAAMRDDLLPNVRIVQLLKTLASFKNTRIIVWSGGGKEYAESIGRQLGIDEFVDEYAGKVDYMAFGKPRPDIAIDDIQDTALGTLNLIVCEK